MSSASYVKDNWAFDAVSAEANSPAVEFAYGMIEVRSSIGRVDPFALRQIRIQTLGEATEVCWLSDDVPGEGLVVKVGA